MHPRAEHASRSVRIDSLRAIGAFAVLGMHVGHDTRVNVDVPWGAFTSHLNVGVTLFFVVSGFLLYRPWARGPARRRRAARAPPRCAAARAASAGLLAGAHVLALWPGLEGVFTAEGWVYSGFAQSYRVDWSFRGLMPAWSLSVEAHFYAFLPLSCARPARASPAWAPRARLAALLARRPDRSGCDRVRSVELGARRAAGAPARAGAAGPASRRRRAARAQRRRRARRRAGKRLPDARRPD
jgi:peptidoglycan/LPS O-acetylase OafA/YrhL